MSAAPSDLLRLTGELIALMAESGLTEAEWQAQGFRLALRRDEAAAPAPALATAPAPVPDVALLDVCAPAAGAFYSASSPAAPPLVKAGDMVGARQALCVMEAMKSFMPIPAPVAGRVVEILAQNGQDVAGGDVLMRLAPEAAHGV